MFLIFTLVLIVMAIRGVVLLIKGEVTDKDYVIRGTVARLIGLCWVSSLILYFVLIALETAVLGASSDAGETTARLLISAIIAIVIGTASAELLKRFSGGKAKTAKSPSGGDPKGKDDIRTTIKLLSSKDREVRSEAARKLGSLKAKESVEYLIAGLDDEYSGMRNLSARALGQIGDERAIEPLRAAMERTGNGSSLGDRELHYYAINALAELGDAQAIQMLPLEKSPWEGITLEDIKRAVAAEAPPAAGTPDAGPAAGRFPLEHD